MPLNREQRRTMSVAQLNDHAAALLAQNEEHERKLLASGFKTPPLVRFEVQIATLADLMFGEGTRRRAEFDIAVQERFAQFFSEENVERMKRDALEAHQRAQLLEGVRGVDLPEPTTAPHLQEVRRV